MCSSDLNHIAAAGSVAAAIAGLRRAGVQLPVEVEVERMAQVEEAIGAGADMLLLDNFTFDQLNGLLKTLSIGVNNLYGKTVRTDPRSGAGEAAAAELVITLQSLQTVVAQMLAITEEKV